MKPEHPNRPINLLERPDAHIEEKNQQIMDVKTSLTNTSSGWLNTSPGYCWANQSCSPTTRPGPVMKEPDLAGSLDIDCPPDSLDEWSSSLTSTILDFGPPIEQCAKTGPVASSGYTQLPPPPSVAKEAKIIPGYTLLASTIQKPSNQLSNQFPSSSPPSSDNHTSSQPITEPSTMSSGYVTVPASLAANPTCQNC